MSLAHPTVTSIFEEDNGLLWVGTDGGGVDILERSSDGVADVIGITNLHYNSKNPNSLSNDRVRTILKDSRGIMWIGTYEKGLNRLDLRSMSTADQKSRRQQIERNQKG